MTKTLAFSVYSYVMKEIIVVDTVPGVIEMLDFVVPYLLAYSAHFFR